ncbi:hypothetical protein KUCAC02_000814 [Chaenocephalus aceratus]|uniref:Uncharacterized protein n=1 Tax=Chaenocephalus aceratus TaxID=36190 RepID=A0ACB9W859_CHAAC|nr:hypothetical protein KUCAC02_000814 [Chaenocephalus aceratus]
MEEKEHMQGLTPLQTFQCHIPSMPLASGLPQNRPTIDAPIAAVLNNRDLEYGKVKGQTEEMHGGSQMSRPLLIIQMDISPRMNEDRHDE